ncbi:MAG: hypothetical protein MRQ11_02875 [Candidatus Midichloria mitochondrii]|nr:hypothetical protein [Candidatus Midichloria mitochondrii]
MIGNLPIISAASTIAKYTVSPIASTVISGVASVLGCAAKGLVFYPVSAFALVTGLTFCKTGDIQRLQPVIEKTGSALYHTGNAGKKQELLLIMGLKRLEEPLVIFYQERKLGYGNGT